jgi:uncharacterized protein GlcG (DUF336 family)
MTVSSDQADAVLAAGRAHAKSLGIAVNIAVLDSAAQLKAFLRMDRALLGSIDIAIGKARTAALFQTSSEAVWEYCKPGAPAHNLESSNGGLMPFAGGLPLLAADGTPLGAIGVSGGAVTQDLEVARAATAALSF